MIGLSGFGFRRKARQFTYKPLYWDEEKEAREARRTVAEMSDPDHTTSEHYVPGSLIRAKRLRRMQSSIKTQRKSRSTLFRVAIFVILLCGALYLMANFIPQFSI